MFHSLLIDVTFIVIILVISFNSELIWNLNVFVHRTDVVLKMGGTEESSAAQIAQQMASLLVVTVRQLVLVERVLALEALLTDVTLIRPALRREEERNPLV